MGNYADEQQLIEINNLPSERWKIRRIHIGRDKKLRRLYKEYNRVRDVIYHLGYEDLNPPVQRGYKRLFVLTEDTKRNSKAALYEGVLEKINTIWYSPVKTFKSDKKRKISKWRYRKRQEQLLRELSEYEFGKADNFTDEEKQLFSSVEYYDRCMRRWFIKYVFNEPWRFVLRVRPNIITQVRRKDVELEQYCDELGRGVDRDWHRIVKYVFGGNGGAWKLWFKNTVEKEKYKYNSLKNIPFYKIVEMYKEEKELWEYEQKI